MAQPRVIRLRYVCTAWCVVESLLFGGLFFGWTSLVYVFKQEGIYSFLCPASIDASLTNPNRTLVALELSVSGRTAVNNTIFKHAVGETVLQENVPMELHGKYARCKEQDAMLNLWFTVAVSLLSIATSLIGFILYRFGPMVLRFVGSGTFCCGSLMLAFVDNSVPWMICPGLFFMSFGAVSISAANLQVIPYLYVRGSSIAVSLLTGFYYSATTTQWCIKVAFEHGIIRQYSYLLLTALNVVIVTTNSLLFFRQSPHEVRVLKVSVKDTEEIVPDREQLSPFVDYSPAVDEKENAETKPMVCKDETNVSKGPASPETPRTLRQCVFNRTFLLHLFWFVVNDFYLLTFIGLSNSMLERILGGDIVKVNHFTDVFSFCLMCAAAFSVVGGLLYDCQRLLFRGYKGLGRHLLPAVFPIAMTTFLGAITVGLQFVRAEEALYMLFIVFVIYKQCVFALTFSFIVDVYPPEYFGVFYGIVFTIAGLVLFLQYAIFTWLASSLWAALQVNAFFFCLIVASLANPVNLLAQALRGQSCFYSQDTENKKMKAVGSSSI